MRRNQQNARQGRSLRTIATALRRHVSIISNEVRAVGDAAVLRTAQPVRRTERAALAATASLRPCQVRLRWSPEEIARRIVEEYPDTMTMRVAPERKRRHKRRRADMPAVERKIEDMLSIEELPAEVATRTVPSNRRAISVLGRIGDSRSDRSWNAQPASMILVPLKNRTADEVRRAFAKEAKKLPAHMRLSMTYDQGREMVEHKLFTKTTQMQVSFANPVSP